MTMEALDTYEAYDIDYTPLFEELIEQGAESGRALDTIVIQGENLEYLEHLSALEYLPHIYRTTVLILGTMIVYITFRLVVSFLSRIFADRTSF